jgi:hypothetical protein
MKTTQLYIVGIALLMYMTYARHHDDHKQKQQEAQVHRQFCAAYTFHPDCPSK